MEEPLLNNCLQPHSLVMTYARCDYCAATDNYAVHVEYLFGLKACSDHLGLAERDCKTDMHNRHLVRLEDAITHPDIAPLMEVLKEGYPVRRTSGAIQPGWTIYNSEFCFRQFLAHVNDEWGVPSILKMGDDSICKVIPLSRFLDDAIHGLMTVPDNFKERVARAVAALEAGIYKAEYDQHVQMRNNDTPTVVPEIPGMQKYEMPDGQIVRGWPCP